MKRFLTTKTKTKTKLHSERLNENESSSSSSSPDKERMFVDLQEQALGNNDKSTTAFPTSNPSSSTIPQRSKSATAALRRMLSRSFSKKVPEDDETQRILEPGREQAEAEAKPQSCKGHTFSLSSLGSSACDRHLRECPRSEIDGCKHDCGSCRRKRRSRRENRERLLQSLGGKGKWKAVAL